MNHKLKKAPRKYNNEKWANTTAKWDPAWDEDIVCDMTFQEEGTLRSGVFHKVLTESVKLGLQGTRKSVGTAVEVIMTLRAEERAPSMTLLWKLCLGGNCAIRSQGVRAGLGMCGICMTVRIQGSGKPRFLPAWELGWCHRHTQGLRLWNQSFKGES